MSRHSNLKVQEMAKKKSASKPRTIIKLDQKFQDQDIINFIRWSTSWDENHTTGKSPKAIIQSLQVRP